MSPTASTTPGSSSSGVTADPADGPRGSTPRRRQLLPTRRLASSMRWTPLTTIGPDQATGAIRCPRSLPRDRNGVDQAHHVLCRRRATRTPGVPSSARRIASAACSPFPESSASKASAERQPVVDVTVAAPATGTRRSGRASCIRSARARDEVEAAAPILGHVQLEPAVGARRLGGESLYDVVPTVESV